MAQKTDSDLLIQKEVIKAENTNGANTKTRIGQMFEDIIDSKVNNDDILDEDDMSSDSATKLASQQSIKAYVDGAIVGGSVDSVPTDSSTNAVSSNGVFDALALKAPLESPAFTGTATGLTKGMVGLGNADNTSDAGKPVSTAQQTALDLKADLTDLDLKMDIADLTQASSYVIKKISTTIYAIPRPDSGLTEYSGADAYTVIQAAIDELTPAGAVGSGGGHIHISAGQYSLSDELEIVGWEAAGGPYSQLIITGDGWSTWLFQATAAKNAVIIRNKPSVFLRDLKITSTERSALLLDSDGADSEQSCWTSEFANLVLESSSTTHPAVYMKNFMNVHFKGVVKIGNPNYHGMILENDSATTFYGNSSFDHIKLFVSAAHAGMLVQSTNTTRWLDHCVFGYFEVGQGLYGIRTSYGQDFVFQMLDLEQVTTCLSLGTLGAGASNNTYGWTVCAGYFLPLTGGTSIHCSQYAGGNRFHGWIDGDATSIPIFDDQQFFNPNIYDVTLGYNVDEANIDITETTLTYLRTTSNFDYTTKTNIPTNTIHQQLRLAAMNAAPASAGATGTLGEIRITAGFLYVCTNTNTWVRVALASW